MKPPFQFSLASLFWLMAGLAAAITVWGWLPEWLLLPMKGLGFGALMLAGFLYVLAIAFVLSVEVEERLGRCLRRFKNR